MNFFAEVPPIEERLMASESVGKILNVLATSSANLLPVRSLKALKDKIPGSDEGRLCDWARAMVDQGLITADVKAGGIGLKDIELTDSGWEASGMDKPFWL